MLTLPYAVQLVGPAEGILLLIFGSVTSLISTIMLGVGAVSLEANTYGKLIERAVRSPVRIRGVSIVDAYLFVYLSGVVITFLIFVGDFVPPIVKKNVVGGEFVTASTVIYPLAFLFVGPMACMNKMNFLKPVAGCSVVVILLTCCLVMAKSATAIPDHWDEVKESLVLPITCSFVSLKALGCMLYAFCIASCVPGIVCEMHKPTAGRVVAACVVGNAGVSVVYFVLAFAVYFCFVGHQWADGKVGTLSDFTRDFSDTDPLMGCCRLGLAVSFSCAMTVVFIAGQKSLYVCIGQAIGQEDLTLGFRKRCLVTYASLIPSAILATNVRDVGKLVSLLGTLGGVPEMLVGPMLLIAFRHIGVGWTHPARVLSITAMSALMCLLWVSTFAV